jgi:hypothetical protein
LAASIELTSRRSSARSTLVGLATVNIEIDPMRGRAADLGTSHVYPHCAQRRSYSFDRHGNRIRVTSLRRSRL